MNLGSLYEKTKTNLIIHKAVLVVAHLMGIWEPSDLIRLGRRIEKSKSGVWCIILQIRYKKLCNRLRIEISDFKNIGDHFCLCHASSVVIHKDAVIGRHCTVYKGVSIGSVRSGKRYGCPVIEDNVYIHANSVVVGGIVIGHDTLIAADTFVDFDVPPHSLVIGNPAVIKHKEYASKDYIV